MFTTLSFYVVLKKLKLNFINIFFLTINNSYKFINFNKTKTLNRELFQFESYYLEKKKFVNKLQLKITKIVFFKFIFTFIKVISKIFEMC